MPKPVAIDASLQDVIYAGLDAIQAAVSIDLCGYLHSPAGYEPQLYLAVPSLASLPSDRALDLFEALRDAAEARRDAAADPEPVGTPDDDLEADAAQLMLAGFHAVVVRTEGADSSGLHAVGRLGRPLDDLDRSIAARLCHALGVATQRLESAAVTLALRSPT